MSAALFIAVDWGTSSMRAFLCQYEHGKSHIIKEAFGPGISKLAPGKREEVVPATLFKTITPLIERAKERFIVPKNKLPIILSGMVGSNIGWKTVPYVVCPATRDNILSACEHFKFNGHPIVIVPGVSNKAFGSDSSKDESASKLILEADQDLMRGEELQILGWMQNDNQNSEVSEQLICLPGTHTKWAQLVKKEAQWNIQYFFTALTGELYSLIKKHSILIPSATTEEPEKNTQLNKGAFIKGLRLVSENPQLNVMHFLFKVRSEQIQGNLHPDNASDFLSGILIGSDVAGAIRLFPHCKQITVLGDEQLSTLFALAINHYGLDPETNDTKKVTIQGFEYIYANTFVQHAQVKG